MKDARRKLRNAAGLAVAATVAAWALWAGGMLERWENLSWDWRVRQTAGSHTAVAQAAADSVCVILLDQASLDWGEQVNGWPWPWPREVSGVIVRFCTMGQAASVGFDVLYTEASGHGIWDDQALGEAIAACGRFIAVPFVHSTPGAERPEVTFPIAEVADNARALANVKDIPDPDGIFRRATLWRRLDHPDLPSGVIPSLGLAAYLLDRDGLAPSGTDGGHLSWSPESVTAYAQRPVLRYCDPEHRWPVYSAAAVIQSFLQIAGGEEPVLDPQVLKGRHVLYGYSAPGLMDLRPTPLSRVAAGVSIHATVLANLLGGGFVREVGPLPVVPIMLLLALGSAFVLLLARKAWQNLLVLVVAVLLPAALGLALAHGGWWWPVAPHTASQVLAVGGAMILAWATEGRQKRFIRSAFRHYLSPHVIERILDDPDQLSLGGERRELSILFSDLEGFTTISEGLEPQALTRLLNTFLSDMTDIILDEGGTLDKYEGDAIIAFWNAPLDQPDHAERACRAAVRCQRRLAERRAEFAADYGVDMKMRVGLNSGPVIVGNMGSKQRFDYTVLGDAANLAARLEGANKVFGTYLMISRDTRDAAGETIVARELGALRVVGRMQPVTVYEVVGLAGDTEPEHWTAYRRGLDLCRDGQPQAAAAVFAEQLEDPAAAHWLARLQTETDGFDPVWNLTKK